MSTQLVDLRTEAARTRVERARSAARATHVALALVLVAAVACAAAEVVRSECHERHMAAQTAAARAATVRAERDRVVAEVAAAEARLVDRTRIPMHRVVALVTEALPAEGYLRRVRFVERGDELAIEVSVANADAVQVASSLRASAPWLACSLQDDALALVVARDSAFEIAVAEPAGGADAP